MFNSTIKGFRSVGSYGKAVILFPLLLDLYPSGQPIDLYDGLIYRSACSLGPLISLEEGIKVTSFTVPEGTSVSQVIARLNLKNWEIGFIQINGTRATKESILKENDTLTLIAPLAGG